MYNAWFHDFKPARLTANEEYEASRLPIRPTQLVPADARKDVQVVDIDDTHQVYSRHDRTGRIGRFKLEWGKPVKTL